MKKHRTENYVLKINPKDYANIVYFESAVDGNKKEGTLHLYCNILIDYDGVSEIPHEIIDFLKSKGINVDYVFST